MRPQSPINDLIKRSKEKYPVVKKLENERVVEFEDGGSDGLCVTEGCDNWYWCSLMAEEVLQLAEFLKELAAAMQFEHYKTELSGATPDHKE